MIGRSMFRRVLAGLGGLLAIFHVWLLASQAGAGRLTEPGLVLRWTLAAGLLAALFGLRQSGASLVRGRGAVAVWLLAALLHAPALPREHDGLASPALPETATAVLQVAAASLVVGLGLALIAAIAASGFPGPIARYRLPQACAGSVVRGRRMLFIVPRPPPLRHPRIRW
jgi:hypothetical protein